MDGKAKFVAVTPPAKGREEDMTKETTKPAYRYFASAFVLLLLQSAAMKAQGPTSIASIHTTLCTIALCTAKAPVISGLDSASVVSPGGKLVVNGSSFNSNSGQPGQVVLKLGSKAAITYVQLGSKIGGFHQPYLERQLTVLGWADSHVFAQIPTDVTGVMDGPATLEVWRDDGAKSSTFVVALTAARDLQILPLDDVALQSCQAAADTNLCNHWSDSSQLSVPAKVAGFASFSIFGQHAMFINNLQAPSTGIDKYSFSLGNGWGLDDSYQFENGIGSSYGCSQDAPVDEQFQGSKPNGSTPKSSTVTIQWHAACNTKYAIALHITGPVGVPWK